MRFAGVVRGELESLLNMCSWFVQYEGERVRLFQGVGEVLEEDVGVGVKWTK